MACWKNLTFVPVGRNQNASVYGLCMCPKVISTMLTGKDRVHKKAASEMLTSTQLWMVSGWSICQIRSQTCEQADKSPTKMARSCKKRIWTTYLQHIGSLDPTKTVHCESGQSGIKHTLYFIKWIHPIVLRADVKSVVKECNEC